MFATYQTQATEAKTRLAALQQAHFKKLSFKNWQNQLQTYLHTNYIKLDLTSSPSLLKLFWIEMDSLESISNDLRADLTTLRDNARLSPIQYSDQAINELLESCKKDPADLLKFSSRNRRAAYYAVILLSRCNDDYHQFKLDLEKAQSTLYFEPGIFSDRLNKRIYEALSFIEQAWFKLNQLYNEAQAQLDSLLSEEQLQIRCETKISAYLAAHPSLQKLIALNEQLTLRQSPQIIKVISSFEAKEQELLALIQSNKTILKEKDKADGVIEQEAKLMCQEYQDSIFLIKIRFYEELRQQIIDAQFELQSIKPRLEQCKAYHREIKRLYRNKASLKASLSDEQCLFSKLYNKVSLPALIDRTLPEIKIEILREFQAGAESIIGQFEAGLKTAIGQEQSISYHNCALSILTHYDLNPFAEHPHSPETLITSSSTAASFH
ncbi:MAG: hypothetical protein K0S29_1239 [Gammaproteobacteria bacterium]|jgi:hypothetical protein|nr:hypothetical protein [Gammaproteobacteria bacterium]